MNFANSHVYNINKKRRILFHWWEGERQVRKVLTLILTDSFLFWYHRRLAHDNLGPCVTVYRALRKTLLPAPRQAGFWRLAGKELQLRWPATPPTPTPYSTPNTSRRASFTTCYAAAERKWFRFKPVQRSDWWKSGMLTHLTIPGWCWTMVR